MLPFRQPVLSLAVLSWAAIAPLSCDRAQVSRQGGGAPADAPGAMPGGFKLPDAAPAGQPPGPAGAVGGPAVGPADPGSVACAMDVHQAERLPVDLLIVLDSSSSMEEKVPGDTRSKGTLVTDALTSFVKDPASAGLGVGLQLFPGTGRISPPSLRPVPCQSDMECAPNLVCRVARECLIGTYATGRRCPEDMNNAPNQSCSASDGAGVGAMCVDAARCTLSKRTCYPPGQPCPGAMPGDMCEPAARQCLEPSGGLLCQPSTYEKLVTPIAELPGAEAPLVDALQNVVFTFGTPMGPAVAGGLAHARAHQTANPTRRVAMVLATDGLPGLCAPQDAAGIAALVAAASMGSPPIPTYAIGVFANSIEVASGGGLLEQVATAGGTDKPFVLNVDPNLARTFLDALEKIREASLPCEFLIPSPNGPIDFGKVNVRLQDAAGSAEEIPYVTAAARCDPMQGGWYYDVDPATAAPTRVLTCPATCGRLKAAPTVNLSLVFGCKTRVID